MEDIQHVEQEHQEEHDNDAIEAESFDVSSDSSNHHLVSIRAAKPASKDWG